jgi:predicted metal-dependent enzyme (double-stranded beta helix superfamily)
MFDLDQLVSDCRAALREDASQTAVREVVARAISDPAAVLSRLGTPQRAEMQRLYRSEDLTILNVIWAPSMMLLHNHRMWAVIGIYTGREDNIFWRRVPGALGGKVEAAGAVAVRKRCSIPGARHYSFREQSDCPPDRSYSCVWGRLFWRAPK